MAFTDMPKVVTAVPQAGARILLPYSMFTTTSARELKKRLTFTVKAFHPKEKDREVVTYELLPETRKVAVPFSFGLQLLQERWDNLRFHELLNECDADFSHGSRIEVSKFPDPFHPLAPEGQDKFFDDLIEYMVHRHTVLAVAPTGSGKTCAMLNAIGKLGKTALVIVPSKEVAAQWRDQIQLHLGLSREEIGTIEEGKCFYEGKKIVVAVIHNLFMRRISKNLRRYFGIVCWDEVHRVSAEMFYHSTSLFNARHRVGLTATPNRKDGLTNVIFDFLGEPCVTARSEAIACTVRVINIPTKMPEWRKLGRGTLITRLTMNRERNIAITRIVKTLYRKGRNILVLSDRVAQLQQLMELCGAGEDSIPSEGMGLYVRSYKDAEGKSKTFKAPELEHVRKTARVIFSTYGMGKESIDIPRLDAGIDATPRADGIQAIGRIRRPYENKKRSVWFTFRDVTIPLLVGLTEARIRDYERANVEVIDHGKN